MQPGYRLPLWHTHPWTESTEDLVWFYYWEGSVPPGRIAELTGLRVREVFEIIKQGHQRRGEAMNTTSDNGRQPAL